MALWLFGSLVLRFSARPWPLALLSEVGLALRCVLWFAFFCDRCTLIPLYSSFEGGFEVILHFTVIQVLWNLSASLRRSALFPAIAPWDRLATPRSTTTASGSFDFWIPLIFWVVCVSFVAIFGLGCSGPFAVRGCRRFVLPPRETPANLFSHTLSALEGRTCRISKAHHYLTFPTTAYSYTLFSDIITEK